MYNYKEEIAPVTRSCEHSGCTASGEHRAPKDRTEKPEYYWFCLEHVREYNQKWNYFSGMRPEEIEAFQKDAMLGHRPTWNYQTRTQLHAHRLRAKLHHFMQGSSTSAPEEFVPPISAKHRQALHFMELEHPANRKTIKLQYKKLVKQYHPDVNQGDKEAEERFKRITESYRILTEEYLT